VVAVAPSAVVKRQADQGPVLAMMSLHAGDGLRDIGPAWALMASA